MSIKKLLLVGLSLFLVYVIGLMIYYSAQPPSESYCPIRSLGKIELVDKAYPHHLFKTINDASCLNQTRVYDIIKVHNTEDIRKALAFAREKKLPISIAGKRHSMGGQAFFKDAVVLDMLGYNKILDLDEKNKLITVQSGATWHDIQEFLDPKKLAIKSMQSSDIFTVGGSLSVNAHGMDHTVGSVASTIRSFTIMLADGSIQKVTRESNGELFNAVIGGYGLFGVVLEIEFEVGDNVMYQFDLKRMNLEQFPQFFKDHQHEYELFYAHLSTSPLSFFKELIVYGYKKVPYEGTFPSLKKISLVQARRFLLNLSKIRSYAQAVKWFAEKYIDPYIITPLKKDTLISRNQVMHDSVEYLENIISDETDILHEYFVPQKNFLAYIEKAGDLLKKRAVVLNASVRIIKKEDILLNYAPQDMFALVLYLNQRTTPQALQAMKELTSDLINLTLTYRGTFFLPYQLYFSPEQLHKAYPSVDQFFALKRKYDPTLLFMNEFYARYA